MIHRLAIVLLLIGAMRIAITYTTFSETADEPMHLSAGLQVLSQHQYSLQLQNPPLPRLLIALPPYLAGARWTGTGDAMAESAAMFHATGRHERMLLLGRVGTLLFFFIGAIATWAWARREAGETTALVALLWFTTQPAILGHSGLATLDAAGAAGVAVSLLALSRWLERPTWIRAAILGVSWGFAINCKLLCIPYVPMVCAAIFAIRLFRDPDLRRGWRRVVTLLVVPPIAALLIWAGYGFSTAPAAALTPVQRAFPDSVGGRWLASLDPQTLVPAPALIRGVAEMIEVNRYGFTGYAMGRWGEAGWWWYFPLALALKTTLASLALLVLGGAVLLARRMRRSKSEAPPASDPAEVAKSGGAFLEAMGAALAILALSMTTHVDIGVRYILPIYVPLSLAVAIAVTTLVRHHRKALRLVAMLAVSWHLIATSAAHPDYLAYFNELARPDPSRYLVDSNLDWGQDTLRLRNEVRRLGIERLGVALFGPADLERLGFPPHYPLQGGTPGHGWVAISDHVYRFGTQYGDWRWLDRQSCQRVGKSIRLCHLP